MFPITMIDPKTGFAICRTDQFQLPSPECTDAVRRATDLRAQAADKCRDAQRTKARRDADAAAAAASWALFVGLVAAAVAASAVGGFVGAIIAGVLFALAAGALSAAVVASVAALVENRNLNDLLVDFDQIVRDFEAELAIVSQKCCPGNPPFDSSIPQCMLQ
jgi:hypothetical protein